MSNQYSKSPEHDLPFGLVHNKTEKCFLFRRTKGNISQYFSYRKGRSFEEIKAEAIAYANEMNERLGPPPPTSPKGRMSVKNRTGVVGVELAPQKVKGHVYFVWVARWPGHRSGTGFSVNQHGEDKAFLLACISRELESKDRELVAAEYVKRQMAGTLTHYLELKRISSKDIEC